MEPTVAQSMVDQFEASAKAAVATVEIIDRAPKALRDAILSVTGDVGRILFAPPPDLPGDLFSAFVRDARVVVDPTAEDWVNTPAGVTEEPSVLAMLQSDFKHLLDDQDMTSVLATNSFEPLQLLWDIAQQNGFELSITLSSGEIAPGEEAVLPFALPAAYVQRRITDRGRAACSRIRCGHVFRGMLRNGRQLRLQA